MTYHLSKGGHTFSCDNCPEVFEADSPDFGKAVRELRPAGWEVRQVGGQWEHVCPECAE